VAGGKRSGEAPCFPRITGRHSEERADRKNVCAKNFEGLNVPCRRLGGYRGKNRAYQNGDAAAPVGEGNSEKLKKGGQILPTDIRDDKDSIAV